MNTPSFVVDDKSASPFVRIEGGRRDGTMIGISDSSTSVLKGKVDIKPFLNGLGLKPREVMVISQDVERALRTGHEPIEPVANAVYKEVQKAPSDPARDFEVHDSHFQCVFGQDMSTNRVAYIFGASGCGKSTQAKLLADEWRKTHKKDPVYIFSRFNGDSDECLKIKNAEYISEADMMDHVTDKGMAIKSDDLTTPCLVICDDYDSFTKKAYDSCAESIKDFLECGRKHGISLIITSHLAVDKTKPLLRTVWNEAHLVGLFPSACQGRLAKYGLETYAGLDKQQINKLLKLPSRCVFLRKPYPQAVSSQHEIYLL